MARWTRQCKQMIIMMMMATAGAFLRDAGAACRLSTCMASIKKGLSAAGAKSSLPMSSLSCQQFAAHSLPSHLAFWCATFSALPILTAISSPCAPAAKQAHLICKAVCSSLQLSCSRVFTWACQCHWCLLRGSTRQVLRVPAGLLHGGVWLAKRRVRPRRRQ